MFGPLVRRLGPLLLGVPAPALPSDQLGELRVDRLKGEKVKTRSQRLLYERGGGQKTFIKKTEEKKKRHRRSCSSESVQQVRAEVWRKMSKEEKKEVNRVE